MMIALSQIDTQAGTQARAEMYQDVIDDYAEVLAAGKELPPIDVFQDLVDPQKFYVADGFHRIAAAEHVGRTEIDCEIKPGGLRSAILHAVGANAAHGLRRTRADKRAAVKRMLDDEKWSQWGVTDIARQCNVSREFVYRMKHGSDEPPTEDDISALGLDEGTTGSSASPDDREVDGDPLSTTPRTDRVPVDHAGHPISDPAMVEVFNDTSQFKAVATQVKELRRQVKALATSPAAAHLVANQIDVDLKNVERAVKDAAPYSITPKPVADSSKKLRDIGYITKRQFDNLSEDQR